MANLRLCKHSVYNYLESSTEYPMSWLTLALLTAGCTRNTSDDSGNGALDSSGPTLLEASWFQAVEVPLWREGIDVRPGERVAPLVADRQAWLRVYVDVPADWETQEVRAELEWTAAGSTQSFSQTLSVAGPSDTAQADGGLLIAVPAEAMALDARYTLSLWAEGATQASARFPESGSVELGAEQTGSIQIHMVPYEIDGHLPETSPAVLDGFRDAVMAVYPTTEVIITVGDPVLWTQPYDIGDILVELGKLQEQIDQAPQDVYYYGLVTGVESRADFEGSTGTSESGFGDRAMFAVGAAFGDQKAEDTLIHELGHMHGLDHTPCGDPGDVDTQYPYSTGLTETEGYDFRTGSFVPTDHADLMGYCFPRWVSDYSYANLADWVQRSQDW